MRTILSLLAAAAALAVAPPANAFEHDITLVGTGCAIDVADGRALVRGGPIAATFGDTAAADGSVECLVQYGDTLGEGFAVARPAGGMAGGIALLPAAAVYDATPEWFVCTIVRAEHDGSAYTGVLDADPERDGDQCAAASEVRELPRVKYADVQSAATGDVVGRTLIAWSAERTTLSTVAMTDGSDVPWGNSCGQDDNPLCVVVPPGKVPGCVDTELIQCGNPNYIVAYDGSGLARAGTVVVDSRSADVQRWQLRDGAGQIGAGEFQDADVDW